jgi:hypothetical protein
VDVEAIIAKQTELRMKPYVEGKTQSKPSDWLRKMNASRSYAANRKSSSEEPRQRPQTKCEHADTALLLRDDPPRAVKHSVTSSSWDRTILAQLLIPNTEAA